MPPADTEQDTTPSASWETPGDGLADPSEALLVALDGYEGPLDLLLALARLQKVDLQRLSVLELANQYLGYIGEAQQLRLEIAADYLVMAAWLAFLKSRLLLPKEKDDLDTPDAEAMAQRLSFRLMRLDAMRRVSAGLMTRKRLGRDVFGRGTPEQTTTQRDTVYTAEVFDLMKAYAELRMRTLKVVHVVKARRVWSIKDARARLEKLVGDIPGAWVQLDLFLTQYRPTDTDAKTALASSFGASLELAREGLIDIRQDQPFAPLYMRRRERSADREQAE